jgi:hypothetical protein
MPVDLNAKPTCELGDFSSLTNPGISDSGNSPVLDENSVFRNRENPEPVNPFTNTSDLRLRIEKSHSHVNKVKETIRLGQNRFFLDFTSSW